MKASELTTLIGWLEDAGICLFEVEQPGTLLHIVMQTSPQFGVIQTNATWLTSDFSKRTLHHVKAKMKGIFLTAHPLNAHPLVAAGDFVAKGDVLGLLKVTDILYVAVLADRPGCMIRTLAVNGRLIEEGRPLFELDVGKSGNLTTLKKKI